MKRVNTAATASKGLRRNAQIRISPVRLIDENNNQAGVVETPEAQRMANDAGLDLVEVAPQASPPVCRIMDFGKWKYEQKKKDHKAKTHRHETVIKTVRMRPKTDVHDQMIKTNRARDFLGKGNKVQFMMLFRGREMIHIALGRKTFNEIKEHLADAAKVERDFKMEGHRLTMVLAPLVTQVAKPAKAPKPPKAPKPAKVAPPAAEGVAAPPEPQAPAE